MAEPLEVPFGIGKYHMHGQGEPEKAWLDFGPLQHNHAPGTIVPPDIALPEPTVRLVFHSEEAIDALIRGLNILRGYFE